MGEYVSLENPGILGTSGQGHAHGQGHEKAEFKNPPHENINTGDCSATDGDWYNPPAEDNNHVTADVFVATDGEITNSVLSITNYQKTVLKTYAYDSYGNQVEPSTQEPGAPGETGTLPFENAITYTGRVWLPELKMYDYRARYYDPRAARFISEDPIWNTNLYAYVSNNPLLYVDPWGLAKCDSEDIPDDIALSLNPIQKSTACNNSVQNAGTIMGGINSMNQGAENTDENRQKLFTEGKRNFELGKQLYGIGFGGISGFDDALGAAGGKVISWLGKYWGDAKNAYRAFKEGKALYKESKLAVKVGEEVVETGLKCLNSSKVDFSDISQLQHTFDKRKEAFGIKSNWSNKTREEFVNVLKTHLDDPGTIVLDGFYRKQPAVHYFNPKTGIDVFTYPSGEFWSSWKLSGDQLKYLMTTKNLN